MTNGKQPPDEVLDLERARDRLTGERQDRAARVLAARFHQAMGWQGKPDGPAGPKKKPKRKKR